jgi:hypothetical protein
MLTFLKRVLPTEDLSFKIGLYVVGVLTILIGVGATIEFTVACLPIPFFWNRTELYYAEFAGLEVLSSVPTGTCMPSQLYVEIPLIASFITDILLFLLPLMPLWKMHLPLFKKISVFFTLSLGLFAIGVDIVRIWEITKLDDHGDVTWLNTPGVAWNSIEYSVAFVSACIPAMAPLLKKDLWKRGAKARARRMYTRDIPSRGSARTHRTRDSNSYLNSEWRRHSNQSDRWYAEDESGNYWDTDISQSRALRGGRDISPQDKFRISPTELDVMRPPSKPGEWV